MWPKMVAESTPAEGDHARTGVSHRTLRCNHGNGLGISRLDRATGTGKVLPEAIGLCIASCLELWLSGCSSAPMGQSSSADACATQYMKLQC